MKQYFVIYNEIEIREEIAGIKKQGTVIVLKHGMASRTCCVVGDSHDLDAQYQPVQHAPSLLWQSCLFFWTEI